jgi:hypothetical protein
LKTIDIAIPWTEILERQARVAAACAFHYLDRVPVTACILPRYWLSELGITWAEYIADPHHMLEIQLEANRWLLEHLDCDITGIGVGPDLFSFYGESYALGCDLSYDELTPWIARHPVKDRIDLERLAAVDITDNRYTQEMERWMARMLPLLGDYQLRYADGVVRPLPHKLDYPGGSIGIFTLATDLRGPDIYVDLYERPDFVHELLSIVTSKVIERYRWLQGMSGGMGQGVYLVDDSSGALSPAHYRTFVRPYVMQVVEALGRPLTIHIDAPANHLLPIYREINIQRLDSFGWGTSLEKVREYLGGRAVLTGNIEPGLFAMGTPEDVYRASWHALEVLAPCGGFILQDGANMVPGAKLDNINAMMAAARAYGLPEQQPRQTNKV